MSDIVVPGFKSSELIAELDKVFAAYSADEKAKLVKQVSSSTPFSFGYGTDLFSIGEWRLPIRDQERRRQGRSLHY
jgi:hypothetical protein